MANDYGYGVHHLRHDTCPNCGTETVRRTYTRPEGGGVNVKKCPRCAPPWSRVTGAMAVILSAGLLAVWALVWAAGTGSRYAWALTALAAALWLVTEYPRYRD